MFPQPSSPALRPGGTPSSSDDDEDVSARRAAALDPCYGASVALAVRLEAEEQAALAAPAAEGSLALVGHLQREVELRVAAANPAGEASLALATQLQSEADLERRQLQKDEEYAVHQQALYDQEDADARPKRWAAVLLCSPARA